MLLNHVWLAAFWVLYGVLHSVLASLSVKRYVEKKYPGLYRHYRFLYNLQAFAGLLLIVWFQWRMNSVLLFTPTVVTTLAGALLCGSGFLLMLFCVKKYFLSLSGLRSFWQELPAESLHVGGVHRFVRHPLYLGTFAFLWGLVVVFPTASLLITAFVITVYTLLGIRWEEEKLVEKFGDDYRAYQRSVPKILPQV